jgi:glucosamine--fructose-6-phosphate aminotransferase (isomerizing)
MEQTGSFTYREITTQTEAWADALNTAQQARESLLAMMNEGFRQIIFTGCGSTYYLSLSAAALFQEMTGMVCRAVPGGELLLNPSSVLTNEKTLLVAVSRSGSTTETVRAVEKFKRSYQGKTIVITNYGDQPLASLADLALVIPKGQETSVAQTRSFASMYVCATAMSALISGKYAEFDAMQSLPAAGQRLLADYAGFAKTTGADLSIDRFYFLGSGSRYGLACETNLKMKEMTLTHSEPFHFMEFRHGPKSMVTPSAVVVGMLSDTNRTHEKKVLDEMTSLGGHVISLGNQDADIPFLCQVPEELRGVLYLPVLQLIAFERSIAKGLNPDSPTNLTKVVELDLK